MTKQRQRVSLDSIWGSLDGRWLGSAMLGVLLHSLPAIKTKQGMHLRCRHKVKMQCAMLLLSSAQAQICCLLAALSCIRRSSAVALQMHCDEGSTVQLDTSV